MTNPWPEQGGGGPVGGLVKMAGRLTPASFRWLPASGLTTRKPLVAGSSAARPTNFLCIPVHL